jgi:hypothetical protein
VAATLISDFKFQIDKKLVGSGQGKSFNAWGNSALIPDTICRVYASKRGVESQDRLVYDKKNQMR